MKALVTGANGFVGRVLCRRLRSAGHYVRAALRRNVELLDADERIVVGEVDGGTEWMAALRDIDVIFHLAAHAHVPYKRARREGDDYRRVNVEGASRLIESAIESGVTHFVFVSSVKVNGETTNGGPFREEDEPRPADEYGRTKLEAELALRAAADRSGMRVTIVRSPLVYGPHVGANFRALLEAVDRHLPLPLAGVDNRRSLVYVENLADALMFLGGSASANHDLFFVSDGPPISTPQLIRAIGHALDRTPLLFAVPRSLLRISSEIPALRRPLQRLTKSLEVDTSRLIQSGWTAAFTLECGLQRTAAWYRTQTKRQT
jgi:nucleoside-diphosphate-sugar epimerase